MPDIEITPRDVENIIPNLKTVGVEDKVLAYEFTGGVYQGVVYTYAQIRFTVVETETGKPVDIQPEEMLPGDERYSLQVGFEYVVFKNPYNKDTDTQHFKEFIGNILTTILTTIMNASV